MQMDGVCTASQPAGGHKNPGLVWPVAMGAHAARGSCSIVCAPDLSIRDTPLDLCSRSNSLKQPKPVPDLPCSWITCAS